MSYLPSARIWRIRSLPRLQKLSASCGFGYHDDAPVRQAFQPAVAEGNRLLEERLPVVLLGCSLKLQQLRVWKQAIKDQFSCLFFVVCTCIVQRSKGKGHGGVTAGLYDGAAAG